MNKQKTLKIMLILLIGVTLILLFFVEYQKHYNSSNNTTTTKKEKNELFKIQNITYNHCKKENDDNCKYVNNTLKHLKLTTEYDKLNDVIFQTNHYVDKKIKEIKDSNLNSNECSYVRETYNYRNIYMMSEFLYKSKEIISISYEIYGIDICTNQNIEDTFNSYIYDIKNNKILTQNEIENLYNIKDSTINETITNNLEYWNKELNTNYTLNDINNDYKLYLSSDGELSIFYKIKLLNKGYSAVIKEKTV